MNDLIKELASDPSCLLAITPEAGGSWLAPFRTQQPRNFAANPMTFTDSYTAQDGIGTDDFTLSVDFTLLEKGVNGAIIIGCVQCVHYGGTKGSHQPSVRILNSDGTKSELYPVGTSHILENVASIKVIKTGQNVRMVVRASDGSIIRDMTKPLPDGAIVTSSSGVTTYPGSISAASIRNDTTGTDVWQAAYSDLYDTSNPWPSPVPRNFAEEPMTWWDEKTTAPAIAEDDCEFFIRYRLDGYLEGSAISRIFYHNSQNGSINIAFVGNGTGGNYSVIRLTNAGAFVIPLDRVRQLGEHTIRIQRIGQTVTVEFDGEIVATSTGAKKVAVYSTTAPVSDFDGVVFETYWESLTTGRTVWSYPSEAERLRLITKTNVRTDRGVFEAADSSVFNPHVATPLTLPNTSQTIIWRGKFDQPPENATIVNDTQVCWSTGSVGNTWTWVAMRPKQIAVAVKLNTEWLSFWDQHDYTDFSKKCTLTLTIDKEASRACFYINEEEKKRFTSPSVGSSDLVHQYPIRIGGTYKLAKTDFLLVFDRALSAAEIKALTPKQA